MKIAEIEGVTAELITEDGRHRNLGAPDVIRGAGRQLQMIFARHKCRVDGPEVIASAELTIGEATVAYPLPREVLRRGDEYALTIVVDFPPQP